MCYSVEEDKQKKNKHMTTLTGNWILTGGWDRDKNCHPIIAMIGDRFYVNWYHSDANGGGSEAPLYYDPRTGYAVTDSNRTDWSSLKLSVATFATLKEAKDYLPNEKWGNAS